MSVTAVSWGPWRAEFVSDRGDVIIRPHRERGKPLPSPVWAGTVQEMTEEGLRAALLTFARVQGQKVLDLDTADRTWMARLVEREKVDA